jgi:hypothetical protein
MIPEDLKGDLMLGAPPIAAFLADLLGKPVTVKNVYYWATTQRFPIGKDGAGLIASRQVITEDYARKVQRLQEIAHAVGTESARKKSPVAFRQSAKRRRLVK